MRRLAPLTLLALAVMFMITLGTTLGGCTSSYTAAAGTNGEDIFREACLRCHQPINGTPERYFTLAENEMNPDYVEQRIRSGTMGMPKFPNIQGAELQALSAFVLGRSTIEAN